MSTVMNLRQNLILLHETRQADSAPPIYLKSAAITRIGAEKSQIYFSDACDFWQFSEFRAVRHARA